MFQQKKISIFLWVSIILISSIVFIGGSFYYRFAQQEEAESILKSAVNMDLRHNVIPAKPNGFIVATKRGDGWEEFEYLSESVDLTTAKKIMPEKVLTASAVAQESKVKIGDDLLVLRKKIVKDLDNLDGVYYDLYFNGSFVSRFDSDGWLNLLSPPDIYLFNIDDVRAVIVGRIVASARSAIAIHDYYFIKDSELFFSGTQVINTVPPADEAITPQISQMGQYLYLQSETYGTMFAGQCGFEDTRMDVINLSTFFREQSFMVSERCKQNTDISNEADCCESWIADRRQ